MFHGARQATDQDVHQFCETIRGNSMQLRPATSSDAIALWYWRNDPETRQASRNTEPVSWTNHVDWLSATLANKGVKLLVAEQDGKPLGTVRFDAADGGHEISWTVAPDSRRQGVATEMVARAIEQNPGELFADIKPGNTASQVVAARNGFVRDGDHDMFQRWRWKMTPEWV